MKSLEEFNKERRELYSNEPKAHKNCIACPQCGEELYDTNRNEVFACYPPKLAVHCDCGYRGYRIK